MMSNIKSAEFLKQKFSVVHNSTRKQKFKILNSEKS